jgi:hypothetical protein
MLAFLEKFREAKTLLQWVEARVPQYGPLVREDVRQAPFRLVSHKAASDYANLIVALEREVNSRS